MDVDTLMIWLVGATSVLGPLVSWRRLGRVLPGWLGVHAVCLAVVVAGLLFWPRVAGGVASLVWFPLVAIPTFANRQVARLMSRRQYAKAARLARQAARFHPFDGWRQTHDLIEAIARQSRGDRAGARERFAELAASSSPVGRIARVELVRLDQDWAQMLDLVAADPALTRDPTAAAFWIRAHGELGRVREMLTAWDDRQRRLVRASGDRWLGQVRLVVAALAGRTRFVEGIARDGGAPLTPAQGAFWYGTALQVADRAEEAEQVFVSLVRGGDPLVRFAALRRLEQPLAPLAPDALDDRTRDIVDRLERDQADVKRHGTLAAPPPGPRTYVTFGLILLNLVAFALEIGGGTTDPRNLQGLGALAAPARPPYDQWWRVITSAFLHFGVLHLLMNMGALWYFGRYLERVLGAARFLLLYALAAPGSMALILLVNTFTSSRPQIVVGASGGVMALVGAILAFMILRWRRHRTGVASRDAVVLGVILGLQTVFDWFTPQISLLGHLSGTVLGVLLGWLLTPRSRLEEAP